MWFPDFLKKLGELNDSPLVVKTFFLLFRGYVCNFGKFSSMLLLYQLIFYSGLLKAKVHHNTDKNNYKLNFIGKCFQNFLSN